MHVSSIAFFQMVNGTSIYPRGVQFRTTGVDVFIKTRITNKSENMAEALPVSLSGIYDI